MDPGALAQTIADQFVTAWNAPVPFLAVCIALWFGLRWFIRGQFETRLANAQSTIEMLEKRLNRQDVEETMALSRMRDRVDKDGGPGALRTKPTPQVKKAIPPASHPTSTLTAAEIYRTFEKETDVSAQKLIADSIGSWITIKGKITNVLQAYDSRHLLAGVQVKEGTALCTFPVESLETLKKNAAVTIRGRLKRASTLGIELEDCELV